MKNFIALTVSIAVAQFAGLVGTVFTNEAIPVWYDSLSKPFFTPPSWVFGPVWITLYTLMGIAAFLVWKKRFQNLPAAKRALRIYGAQLIANAAWSMIFFGLKMPGLAYIEILLLLGLILATVHQFRKLDQTAAYLLIPYVLWVTFASKLNLFIWILNRGV